MKDVIVSRQPGHVSPPAIAAPAVELDRASQNFPPQAAREKGAPRVHLGFLDGLRGLAVLYVVAYHLWLSRHYEHLQGGVHGLLTNWLQFGHLAVDVFIVLSGFCLMLPVARQGELTGGAAAFFKKRARRILPPFWAAVLLGLACNAAAFAFFTHGRLPGLSFKNLLANILLLQDVHPACNNINGAFWSVAVEWKIYLLFPVLVWAWRRFGLGAALAAAVGIGYGLSGVLFFMNRLALVSPHAHVGLTLTCPWYVALFGMGMWAAGRAFGPQPRKQINGKWMAGFAASIALLIGLLFAFPHHGDNQIYVSHWPAIDGAAGLVTALGLLWLGVKMQTGGTPTPVHRALSWRPLAFVGSIGYSVYLTHLAVIHVYMALMGAAVRHGMAERTIELCLFGIGLPLIFLVAYGFFAVFERPFLNAGCAKSVAKPKARAAQPVAAPAANGRFEYVDVLRGLAFLWVALCHSPQPLPVLHGLSHLPFKLFVHVEKLGWLGVSLFLVLSGFCLYLPLVRKQTVSEVRLDAGRFWKRRAGRILPTYYVSLALMIAYDVLSRGHSHLPYFGGVPSVKDVLLHVLLLHNLTAGTFASIDGVYWSLALECQLYVLFPLLVWLAARRGLRAILGVTLGVSLVWQCVAFHLMGTSLEWTPRMATLYHALPGRCFEFAAGMCAAAWVARPQAHHWRLACRAGLAAASVGLVYATFIGRFGPLCDQLWGVAFACLLLALARVPSAVFSSSRVLRSLNAVGTFSFSLYVVHAPLLAFLAWVSPQAFGMHPAGEAVTALFTVLRIALIVPIGYGFYLVAEKPFLHKPARAVQAPAAPAPAVPSVIEHGLNLKLSPEYATI